MNINHVKPTKNLRIKQRIRKQRVGYTKSQYEQMINVVERYDFLNASNDAILTELIRLFPKVPPTYDVLTTLRKKIKVRNKQDYDILKTKNDDFIAQVIKKRRNLYYIRSELLQIYGKPEQSDLIKLKILDKLIDLDIIDLQFIQDFPYLHKYHEDIEREYNELDEDIKQNRAVLKNLNGNNVEKVLRNPDKVEHKVTRSTSRNQDGYISNDGQSKNNQKNTAFDNIQKIPIEEISPDKEIQRILSSRDQSGFTRHSKRDIKDGDKL
ncbi:MAG: hypothetical protein AB7V56_06915 [Candidatus Nitrosocosmicus sp.]